MIKVKIVESMNRNQEDSDVVVKIVIVDNENRVLMLTRSDYHKKYAGQLDLPGGHVKKNEPLNKGLRREVKEETNLDIKNVSLFKTVKNKHYFFAKYDSQPIKLSDEHTDYAFYEKKDLDSTNKFQKIALEVLEKIKND